MTCSQYVHIGNKKNSILQILSHLKEDDLRMDCLRSFLNKAFTVTCNWTDNIMTLLPQKSTKKNRINDGDINNALRIDHEYKRMKLRLSYKKCNFDEWNANITNLYRVCCECIPNISANVLLTSRIYTEYVPVLRMNCMKSVHETAVVLRIRCISIASAKRR